MPIVNVTNPVLAGQRSLRTSRFDYAFATHGGVSGTIVLTGDAIPIGAFIRGGFIRVVTPPTSGGAATISAGAEAAADLQAAAAISGAPWSTAGRKSIVPAFTGATSIALTAARTVSIVVATADLTAGVFSVFVDWIL